MNNDLHFLSSAHAWAADPCIIRLWVEALRPWHICITMMSCVWTRCLVIWAFFSFPFLQRCWHIAWFFSPKLVVRDIQIGYLSCSIFQMIIHTWSDNYTYTLAQEIFKACFNYLDSLFSLKDAIKQFAKYL